mmetsp:Transcript_123579/g.320962  ORF Transcript_123579/g.320962 Transcript_123579/m.320962 type:complete len:269 (-) Transcript_123579:288-1094(-)
MFTTVPFLGLRPPILPICDAIIAIIRLTGGCTRAARILVRATPSLLLCAPRVLPICKSINAIPRIACFLFVHAAVSLLPRGPAKLPVGVACSAIEWKTCGCGASLLLVRATPSLLLNRPPVRCIGEASAAIEGVATPAGLLAAIVLLALGPAKLPIRVACIAIIRFRSSRAPEGPVGATPPTLFWRPRLMCTDAFTAVPRVASMTRVLATPSFLYIRPRLFPIGAQVAIELVGGWSCSGCRRGGCRLSGREWGGLSRWGGRVLPRWGG